MNNSTLYMALIDDSIKLVTVQFHNQERGEFSGKMYTYKTDISDLRTGEVVVCEANMWFSVARVIDDNVMLPMDDDSTKFRWIVQRVDTVEHAARLDFERDAIKAVNDMRRDKVRTALLNELGLTQEGVDRIKMLARGDDIVIEPKAEGDGNA